MGLSTAAPRAPEASSFTPRAPLLPRLRGHYAEFLDHGSPDRLGILYPPTCVGFGTGGWSLPRGFFSEAWAHRLRQNRLRLASRALCGGGFPCPAPYALSRGRPEPRPATLLRRPVGRSASSRYGNIDPLRIGYAFRPRLSSRLTLGGLALPRKPRVHGGRVTLSSLATHASILAPERSTEGRPLRFAPDRDAPLPLINQSAASAPRLAP